MKVHFLLLSNFYLFLIHVLKLRLALKFKKFLFFLICTTVIINPLMFVFLTLFFSVAPKIGVSVTCWYLQTSSHPVTTSFFSSSSCLSIQSSQHSIPSGILLSKKHQAPFSHSHARYRQKRPHSFDISKRSAVSPSIEFHISFSFFPPFPPSSPPFFHSPRGSSRIPRIPKGKLRARSRDLRFHAISRFQFFEFFEFFKCLHDVRSLVLFEFFEFFEHSAVLVTGLRSFASRKQRIRVGTRPQSRFPLSRDRTAGIASSRIHR